MFDVNPNPDAAFAALDLTPGVQGASRDELVESAEYFHVGPFVRHLANCLSNLR